VTVRVACFIYEQLNGFFICVYEITIVTMFGASKRGPNTEYENMNTTKLLPVHTVSTAVKYFFSSFLGWSLLPTGCRCRSPYHTHWHTHSVVFLWTGDGVKSTYKYWDKNFTRTLLEVCICYSTEKRVLGWNSNPHSHSHVNQSTRITFNFLIEVLFRCQRFSYRTTVYIVPLTRKAAITQAKNDKFCLP
jgi:hypothetical protein